MVSSRTLEVRFLGDVEDVLRATRSLNQELGGVEQAQERVTRSSDRMGSSWRSTFTALEGARVPLLATSAAVIGLGAASVKAASDLGEAESAVNETFDESSAAISEFAATSAEAYGVSKRAANEYAATLGGILNASGLTRDESAALSVQAIQLAADLGSLRNLGVDEALEKIRAGLVGETEPLRTVGVLLSDAAVRAKAAELGLSGLNGELTEGEKVRARFAIITEQLAVAEGNFGRTLGESLPNQAKVARAELENAAATLGERLLPYMVDATAALADLVGAFANLPAPVQEAALVVGGLTLGITGLGLIIPPVVTAVNGLRTAVQLLNLAMAANPAVVAVVAGAAVAAAVAWGTYATLSEAAAQANTTFSHTADEVAESMNPDAIRAQIFEYEYLRGEIQRTIDETRGMGVANDDLEQQVVDLNEEIEGLRRTLATTTPSVEELGLAEAATRGPTEVLAAAMDDGAGSARNYANELSNLSAKALAARFAMQTTADGTPEELDARFEDAVTQVRRALAREASLEREVNTILQAADPTGYFAREPDRPGLGRAISSSSGGGGGGGGGTSPADEAAQRLEEAGRLDVERRLALATKAMEEAELAATDAIKARTAAEKEALDAARATRDFWRSSTGTAIARDLGPREVERLNAEILTSIRGGAAPASGPAFVDVVVP